MKSENLMPGETITTNCYKISKDCNGIVHREIFKDAHIHINEAKHCEETALAMNGGKKMLALVDARHFHTITPEATEYLKSAHFANRIATAVVSSSLSEKITAGYIGKDGENRLKIFCTKEEAVEWLKSHK